MAGVSCWRQMGLEFPGLGISSPLPLKAHSARPAFWAGLPLGYVSPFICEKGEAQRG